LTLGPPGMSAAHKTGAINKLASETPVDRNIALTEALRSNP